MNPIHPIYSSLIILILISLIHIDDVVSSAVNNNYDEYFYDQPLSSGELEKLRLEKIKKEQTLLDKTTKEPEPDFFNQVANDADPMKLFLKKKIKELQEKEIEKYKKSKSKNELNHHLWSVLTLSIFFGSGIIIGILIIFIRGHTLSNNRRNNNNRKSEKENFPTLTLA
jgi:F0F1-type ATP synthase assembly protein I